MESWKFVSRGLKNFLHKMCKFFTNTNADVNNFYTFQTMPKLSAQARDRIKAHTTLHGSLTRGNSMQKSYEGTNFFTEENSSQNLFFAKILQQIDFGLSFLCTMGRKSTNLSWWFVGAQNVCRMVWVFDDTN